MKQQLSSYLWLVGAIPVLAMLPIYTEGAIAAPVLMTGSSKASTPSIRHLSEVTLPHTRADLLTQDTTPIDRPASGAIEVRGVRLNQTEQGLEIVLEVPSGQTLQAQTRTEGNALIADIPNAVLVLPEGQEFRSQKPAARISNLTVTQVEPTRIRITVTGTTTAPFAEIVPDRAGLILSVEPDDESEEEVVVTATRTEEPLSNLPRSVTVIPREQIQQQTALTNNLPDLLGKLVPGLGPPTQRNLTRGLTLRGRQALILIDGVPQNPNSGFQTELNTIDPSAIERVEVVRGPSALYGRGATGGIINIITRRATTQRLESQISVGVRNALDAFSDEGFGYNLQYGLSGKEGPIDVTVRASLNESGSFFDANGDRIPPTGINDATSLNLLAKLGIDIDSQQRLQLSYNIYNESFDTTFRSDPIVFSIPGLQTARAQRFPVQYAEEPRQTNQVANLTYTHQNIFGSQVTAQLFFRDTNLVQPFTDLRGRPFPVFFPALWQTSLDSQELGARLQIQTPFSTAVNLLWGVDYSYEENSRPVLISETSVFDRTRTLTASSTRPQTPFYTLNNLGLFAQLQWNLSPQVLLSGGLRYDNFSYEVGDYELAFAAPGVRRGGSADNSGISFNTGIVYKITPQTSIFASFAQGFSLPDLGTAFSSVAPRASIRGSDLLEPQKVDSFELGVRGNWGTVQASLAGFYSTSDLGATVRIRPDGTTELQRAPQRNYGLEATLDWQPTTKWRLGSTFTWSEGENDTNNDDDFLALSSLQVPPLKLSFYVENETLPNWRNRLQLLLVGNRDRAFDDRVDPFRLENYTTLDFLSSLKLGQSTLELGIENLLNTQYLPLSSQERTGLLENLRFAGRGRTIFLRYAITF